jgi:tripartite-type tricarboxylate transporter receptor subunit TctC
MNKVAKGLFAMLLVPVFSLCCGMAAAQTYPAKPIRFIAPFAAGGGNDIIGRMIAARLTEHLGKQVIVDNRGGAGGVIGTEMAAHATPDGHTLLIIAAAHTVNASLHTLPYDPIKSFTPVAKLATAPGVLAVHPSVPVNSVKELIAFLKENPGKLTLSTAGAGSSNHLGAALLQKMAGIDFKIVHFKGGGPSLIDQLGGHSQLSYNTIMLSLPHIKSGKLKALGVGGLQRSAVLPDVPTISEAGLPGYEAVNWYGILVPAGTPKPIVDRLHKELNAIMKTAEVVRKFQDQGADVSLMGPAEFGPFIAAEIIKWGRVVKEANIKAE